MRIYPSLAIWASK